MWRTLVGPALHRPVAVLRVSCGGNLSRICFIHGNGNQAGENDAKESTSYNSNIIGYSVNGSVNNISKAQNVIYRLLKGLDIDKTMKLEYNPLIDIGLNGEQDKKSSKDCLAICSPRKEQNKEQSGFGCRNICLSIEKWCYGVVVVSSLISWHRLFFNDDIRNGKNDMLCHIHHDTPSLHPYILPVNGPAKPIDPIDAAFSAFEDAVQDGTAVTQNALGIKFSELNMPKQALTYFRSASDKGNTAAHFNLGICYEKGIGTATNISKAIDSYSSAASKGHSKAAYNLGGIYLEGKHITRKRNEGLELIERAAKNGLLEAQTFLGLYYADESNERYDMTISVKWLQAAADRKDVKAQYHLGICYERGLGVGQNMRQARKLYEEAAKNGHVGAQYNIGVFYEHGLGDVSVNKYEALRWYKVASDGGNMNAKHNFDCLQQEVKDIEKRTKKSVFLRRLLPDICSSQELVAPSNVLPRCTSSPGRLYLTNELTQDDAEKSELQKRTSEDNKCILVI